LPPGATWEMALELGLSELAGASVER